MLANQKTDPKLPPPLPSGKPPPLPPRKPAAGGGIARARAFLAIQRMRLGERTRRIVAWVRRRPLAASAIAAAVILVAAGGAAIALDAVPDVDLNPFAPKSLADARAEARTHPDKATAKRELGHALWAAKRHHSAVRAYSRALAADAGVADDQMISHLVASFGGRDQREAEALIWKNKLVGAEAGLHGLLKSKRHGVRWGAVHTLDRLEKGTRANWETAYILDLDSSECDVRRTAVDKLGAIGTRRAVAALREAKMDDEKNGGWFRSRCLGERVDDAEQKILARR